MRSKPLIMIVIAVVFGAVSIFVADIWMTAEAPRPAPPVAPDRQATEFASLVVATRALGYGERPAADALGEIPWPADALPHGTYPTIDALLADGDRVVLSPIAANEPVLRSKLSGRDGRATLSNTLAPGKRAVTVRVDDLAGVAGFIAPGDRVDIVLIREGPEASAEVIVQNVPVITVDQSADLSATAPQLADAVTVEVDVADAQKITLARTVGTLSLSLRAAGDDAPVLAGPTTMSALGSGEGGVDTTSLTAAIFGDDTPRHAEIVVDRALAPTAYMVLNEDHRGLPRKPAAPGRPAAPGTGTGTAPEVVAPAGTAPAGAAR